MKRLLKSTVVFLVVLILSSCSKEETLYSELSAIPFTSAEETITVCSETSQSDSSSEYHSDVEYDESTGHIGAIGSGNSVTIDAFVMPTDLPDNLNVYHVDNRVDFDNLYEFADVIAESAGDDWFVGVLNDIYYVWGEDYYLDENGNGISTTDDKIIEYMDSYEYVDLRSNDTVNEVVDVLPNDIEYADYMMHYVFPDQEGYKYDLRNRSDFDNVTDYGNDTLEYYVIRPSLDNIPIGTTQDSALGGPLGRRFVCVNAAQPENSRYSNGEYVVDVWNDNLSNYEVIRSDLSIIPIQDCIGNAMEYFSWGGFSSDTRVYGIELIYIEVKESLSTGEVAVDGDMNRNVILYPVWALYYQSLMRSRTSMRGFVFLDAVNGEYLFSASSYLCSVVEEEFSDPS